MVLWRASVHGTPADVVLPAESSLKSAVWFGFPGTRFKTGDTSKCWEVKGWDELKCHLDSAIVLACEASGWSETATFGKCRGSCISLDGKVGEEGRSHFKAEERKVHPWKIYIQATNTERELWKWPTGGGGAGGSVWYITASCRCVRVNERMFSPTTFCCICRWLQ